MEGAAKTKLARYLNGNKLSQAPRRSSEGATADAAPCACTPVCVRACVYPRTHSCVCVGARSREHVSASVLGITLRTKSHSAAVKPVAGL
ncbi:MAG: hypothetical protein ACPIOQ_25905, partial [Promethearchaeia archaeon]